MQFLFVTPVVRSTIDGGATISGMKILSAVIDPDALTCTVVVQGIEDLGPAAPIHKVVVPVTGAMTLNAILAAVKAQVAAALSITFQ